MKTKKFFSVAALIICGMVCVSSANANTSSGGTSARSEPVTVNIKFTPIQSITVNPDQSKVNLEYNSVNDYELGVSQKKENHLTVFSTGGFVVSVKSDGNFKKQGGSGASSIDASDVRIEAERGSETELGNFTSVTLSESEKALITSAKGGNKLNYNITYNNKAGANYKYIDMYFDDDATSVYTATVTYTIATN